MKTIRLSLIALAVLALGATPTAFGQMYYTNGSGVTSQVGRANLDGTGAVVIVPTGLNGGDGIRADFAGGKLYWAEQAGNIQRSNLDGTDVELVIAAGGNPHAVALDVAAGKVYWTELANDRIRRANLDGTSPELVISVNSPDGLAIDPAGGKIYWSRGGVVRRADLDGTGNELLYSNGTPHGIALDVAAGKMYWTNLGNGRIQRGDMDGSGPLEDLVTGLATPLDVSLDLVPGKMYWTELGGGGTIKRANLDGTGVETLLDAEISGAFGVVVRPTGPSTPIPTMPEWGLILLVALLLVAGSARLARGARIA